MPNEPAAPQELPRTLVAMSDEQLRHLADEIRVGFRPTPRAVFGELAEILVVDGRELLAQGGQLGFDRPYAQGIGFLGALRPFDRTLVFLCFVRPVCCVRGGLGNPVGGFWPSLLLLYRHRST